MTSSLFFIPTSVYGWRDFQTLIERNRDRFLPFLLLTDVKGHVDAWSRCRAPIGGLRRLLIKIADAFFCGNKVKTPNYFLEAASLAERQRLDLLPLNYPHANICRALLRSSSTSEQLDHSLWESCTSRLSPSHDCVPLPFDQGDDNVHTA